jgi:hypothetical protein
MSSHLINGQNVGMIQRPSGFRFNLESNQAVGLSCRQIRQNFDCHFPVQAQIVRPIDLTHAPRTEWREDFILTKLGPGGQGHAWAIIAPDSLWNW